MAPWIWIGLVALICLGIWKFIKKQQNSFNFQDILLLKLSSNKTPTHNVIYAITPSKFPDFNNYLFAFSDFTIKSYDTYQQLKIDEFIELLLDDKIILTPLCIDNDLNIILIQTPKHISLTNDNHTNMAFFFQSQTKFCTQNTSGGNKIYSIPYRLLPEIIKKVKDKLSNIDYNVLFIQNMGRCGSNLICNLLSNYDDIQCVKETNILRQLACSYLYALKHNKNTNNNLEKTMMDLIDASVVFLVYALLKNTNYKQNKIVFKESSQVAFISHLICKTFGSKDKYPNFKHIYMFRNAYDQLDSILSLFVLPHTKPKLNDMMLNSNKWIKYIYLKLMTIYSELIFSNDIEYNRDFGCVWWGIHTKQQSQKIINTNFFQILFMGWSNSIEVAYKLLKDQQFEFSIKYNDIKQGDTTQFVKNLLIKLKWDSNGIQKNVDNVMKKDSHELSGGLRSIRKGGNNFVSLTNDNVKYIEKYLSTFSEYQTIDEKYCFS